MLSLTGLGWEYKCYASNPLGAESGQDAVFNFIKPT